MLLYAGAAAAQGGDDLNRQVNVAKDYTPRVDRAAKLSIVPQMEDTVKLRPEFDYTVRPRAWVSGFGVEPIRAAQIDRGSYLRQYPVYLKAGGGYPGQSVLDFYATSTRPGGSGFGAYVNHRAQFADIKNDFGAKANAKSTNNSAGLFGRAAFGRLSIAGEIGFDYDIYTHYGNAKSAGVRMQHYALPRAGLVFGHDFTDMSRFNFRLGADGYMLLDRHQHGEAGGNIFIEMGKDFGAHGLSVRADYAGWKGRDMNGASASVVSVTPRYEITTGNLTFVMGAKFAYDMPQGIDPGDSPRPIWEEATTQRALYANSNWGKKFWFLPELEVNFRLAGGGFNPYVRLNSELKQNSYLSMSRLNPYLDYDFSVRSAPAATAQYKLHAGFAGTLGSVFSYNLYAGYGITKNYAIAMNIMGVDVAENLQQSMVPGDFLIDFIKELKGFTAGADFDVKAGGFTATLGGEYNSYAKYDGVDKVDFIPKFHAWLSLEYRHRDKWAIRAGARLRGEYTILYDRYSYSRARLTEAPPEPEFTVPTAVDITLGVDYNITEKIGAFIEAGNLANQKLYPYAFYRGVGTSITAGVRLKF